MCVRPSNRLLLLIMVASIHSIILQKWTRRQCITGNVAVYSCHYQSPVCTVHFVVSVSFIIHSICFETDGVLTTSSRSGKFGFYGVEVDEVFFFRQWIGHISSWWSAVLARSCWFSHMSVFSAASRLCLSFWLLIFFVDSKISNVTFIQFAMLLHLFYSSYNNSALQ